MDKLRECKENPIKIFYGFVVSRFPMIPDEGIYLDNNFNIKIWNGKRWRKIDRPTRFIYVNVETNCSALIDGCKIVDCYNSTDCLVVNLKVIDNITTLSCNIKIHGNKCRVSKDSEITKNRVAFFGNFAIVDISQLKNGEAKSLIYKNREGRTYCVLFYRNCVNQILPTRSLSNYSLIKNKFQEVINKPIGILDGPTL
jgi:hypothetical protein